MHIDNLHTGHSIHPAEIGMEKKEREQTRQTGTQFVSALMALTFT